MILNELTDELGNGWTEDPKGSQNQVCPVLMDDRQTQCTDVPDKQPTGQTNGLKASWTTTQMVNRFNGLTDG